MLLTDNIWKTGEAGIQREFWENIPNFTAGLPAFSDMDFRQYIRTGSGTVIKEIQKILYARNANKNK